MYKETKNNNLNYLIDPTFTKVNRLFVLSFKSEGDNRKSFFENYTRNFQIKDCLSIELENSDSKNQINFNGRLDKDAAMSFMIEKSEETCFEFLQSAVTAV